MMKQVVATALCLVLLASVSSAFSPPQLSCNPSNSNQCIHTSSSSKSRSHLLVLFNQPDDEDQPLPPNNEQVLEELSRQGASRIRDMSISERTKRAMLAEQVEDDIFRMQEKLEELIPPTGMIPEEVREDCVAIAQEMKVKQEQYEALVTGAPSSILSSLENLGKSLE